MDDILYIRTQVAEEVIYGGNLDPDFEPHVETEQQIGSLVIQTYEVQLTKGLVIIYQGGRVNMRGGGGKKIFWRLAKCYVCAASPTLKNFSSLSPTQSYSTPTSYHPTSGPTLHPPFTDPPTLQYICTYILI